MARTLVQSTSFPWAVSSESKTRLKQSGGKKRAVKMMCSLQTPPMRVTTFSALPGVNGLSNMVNRSHGFHLTVASATSVWRGMVAPIVPKPIFEGFTENANKVVEFAQKEARESGYSFVGTKMILLGLICDDTHEFTGEGIEIAAKVLCSMGIYMDDARDEVEEIIGSGSRSDSVQIPFSPHAKQVFELSIEEARRLGHDCIGSAHLLLGLLRVGGGANLVLRNLDASPDNIRTQVIKMLSESGAIGGGGSSGNIMPTLDEYGINLGELACENTLNPFVEREAIIKRAIQILGRHRKNNPCLVGERGVGKTSIAVALAYSIAHGDVPDRLKGKKVITLDVPLIAQGGFEERLKKIMEEIKKSGDIILFLDDVHTLFGAGAAEGGIGAVNILKRALAKGEVQCIAATTPDEYRKHIEKDPALERLFQPVKVSEATVDETITILMGIRKQYEHHHKLSYSKNALIAAALMSSEFISDRFLPGKAIDLIDEAGSFVRGEQATLSYSKLLEELKRRRQLITITKEEFSAVKDLGKAGLLWDQQMDHRIHILDIEERIEEMENVTELGPTVTEADINTIISSWNLHF